MVCAALRGTEDRCWGKRRRRRRSTRSRQSQLLELLEIKGCIVTIGAMGCPTKIAAQVVAEGGDDVLGLAGSQGTLHEEG